MKRNPSIFIDKQNSPAEAVITEVTGNTAKLWFGGLDRESLEAFNKGAVFAIVDANGRRSGKVTLVSRKGLIGEGTVEGTTQAGALLQEAARSIPSDLKLRIGLDASLGGEINSAKQALQGNSRIEVVPVPYSGEVQYLLGRVTAGDYKVLSSKIHSVGAKHSGDQIASQPRFSYPNASPSFTKEISQKFAIPGRGVEAGEWPGGAGA
jgi:hypothetical protein